MNAAAGEEVAWDYSTPLSKPGWRMPCACGSVACRGTIDGFETLPIERRHWFLEHDMVAPDLRETEPAVRAA